jgi:hypothetical protein
MIGHFTIEMLRNTVQRSLFMEISIVLLLLLLLLLVMVRLLNKVRVHRRLHDDGALLRAVSRIHSELRWY